MSGSDWELAQSRQCSSKNNHFYIVFICAKEPQNVHESTLNAHVQNWMKCVEFLFSEASSIHINVKQTRDQHYSLIKMKKNRSHRFFVVHIVHVFVDSSLFTNEFTKIVRLWYENDESN